MQPTPYRSKPTSSGHSTWHRLGTALLLALLVTPAALAQAVRPTPPIVIGPGGGGNAGGGGGPGIGLLPIIPGGPGTGEVVDTGPRIVAATGILAGQSSQASVVVPNATAGSGGNATTTTYQWTISGGKITSDPTRQSVIFTADNAGTVSLNVVVTTAGSGLSTSTDIVVLSPALAGTITANTTVTTAANNSNTTFTASVPAAQNGDRTFRWTVAGNGAAIVGAQNNNTVNIRPGNPGLVEVMCDVTLQRVATITLRSFVRVTGNGAPVALAVDGGTGGGTYPAGSRVDIFALPPGPGQVFDRWTGDTAILGNAAISPLLAHAVVTVPNTPATLTATYRSVATWTPATVANFNPIAQTSPNGTSLTYHIPPAARGVVFLLHDTGGTGAAWFSNPESLTLARDLVAAGYGVAALNAVNRTTAAWSAQPTLAANPDASTLAAAFDRFVSEGALASNQPIFLLGQANGADAAGRYADLLVNATPSRPVRGVVAYLANGGATLPVTTRVAQFFALASHDAALDASGLSEAQNNVQLLVGRGVPAAAVSNATSPVHPNRFRILGLTAAGFTADDAQAIWTAIKSAGFLDANNYPKSAPTVDAVRAALPAAYQSRAAEVAAQIAIAFGAQEFFSDANARVINFLNGRVNNAPTPTPGRLVNLSTRGKVVYVGDTFTVGFSISGTQRSTLLIRGIGPALTRFGVSGVLPAPRLEVRRGNTLVDSNEGWDTVTNAAQVAAAASGVGAFPLAPGALDAALLLQLDPGNYTATLRGINGSVGDALTEIYDVSRNGTRLTNLSVLSKITVDGDVLIPGIVVAGNNPRTVVVRAVAQGLSDLGVPAANLLGDARIIVFSGNQAVANNNNWAQGGGATLTAAFPAVGAFPLRAATDAALIDALAPGSYTLQAGAAPVGGAAATATASQTGTVLVEVYEVP